ELLPALHHPADVLPGLQRPLRPPPQPGVPRRFPEDHRHALHGLLLLRPHPGRQEARLPAARRLLLRPGSAARPARRPAVRPVLGGAAGRRPGPPPPKRPPPPPPAPPPPLPPHTPPPPPPPPHPP